MGGVELEAKTFGSQLPSRVAIHRQCVGDRSAEKGISKSGEDEPQRGFADVMLFMSHAELGNERPDRFQDRVQGVSIARQDHPRRERSRTFAIEGVESTIDDFASFGFPGTSPRHGFGNAPRHPLSNGTGELGLKPGRRPEMVEQVGVGPADLRRHCFQGDRLGTLFEQKLPGSFQCGGPALFGVEAFTAY